MFKHKENFFTTHDNTELYYQHWIPNTKSDKAIVLFHRGHEHSDRMKHLVTELALNDHHFFAWDARGHGKSPGDRGYAPNVACVTKDIDVFIKHISKTYQLPIENIIVLGQSVGAVTLSTWLHDYAPKVKAAILASPAFKVKLYIPFAIPSLKLFQKLSSKTHYVNSYVKGAFLSHDPLRIEEYNIDPSITRPIAINMLTDLFDTAKRIVSDSYAIETPVLMLTSGNDFVVEKEPQYSFFAKLPSVHKEIYELPDFYHDTLGEKNRELAYQYIRSFIHKIESTLIEPRDLTQLNPYHFSQIEVDKISKASNELENAIYRLQQKALSFGSEFSDALKIGEKTGYDSGSSLDYVYKNKATSNNLVGKIIDKTYLSAVGWKGIRVRKLHLEKAFDYVHKQLKGKNKKLKFIDIAAGHGRYDIDFLKTLSGENYQAILNDYSDINVQSGKELIEKEQLNQVKFVQGNAFDSSYIKSLTKGSNLVVVSGLYELYPDNQLIENSLKGISEGLSKGAYLVYTNQPWHPQLKFIAKVLSSHRNGQPWVMRRRTQNEMDQLVEKFGFEKIEEYIDQYGIFTVSIAIKK